MATSLRRFRFPPVLVSVVDMSVVVADVLLVGTVLVGLVGVATGGPSSPLYGATIGWVYLMLATPGSGLVELGVYGLILLAILGPVWHWLVDLGIHRDTFDPAAEESRAGDFEFGNHQELGETIGSSTDEPETPDWFADLLGDDLPSHPPRGDFLRGGSSVRRRSVASPAIDRGVTNGGQPVRIQVVGGSVARSDGARSSTVTDSAETGRTSASKTNPVPAELIPESAQLLADQPGREGNDGADTGEERPTEPAGREPETGGATGTPSAPDRLDEAVNTARKKVETVAERLSRIARDETGGTARTELSRRVSAADSKLEAVRGAQGSTTDLRGAIADMKAQNKAIEDGFSAWGQG